MRIIPFDSDEKRVETGVIQFGLGDWPGVFIRGDQANYLAELLAMELKGILDKNDVLGRGPLEELINLLRSCRI